MSRQKVWTRVAAQRRRQDAAAAEAGRAAEQTAQELHQRSRRRRTLRSLAVGVSFAAVTGAALTTFDKLTWASVITSLVVALLLVGSAVGYIVLRRPLGKLTAVAALALIAGVLLLATAATSSQCPGNDLPGRCGVDELASWGLVGMMLPVLAWVLFGIPVIITTFVYRLSRWVVRAFRTAATDTTAGASLGAAPTDRKIQKSQAAAPTAKDAGNARTSPDRAALKASAAAEASSRPDAPAAKKTRPRS